MARREENLSRSGICTASQARSLLDAAKSSTAISSSPVGRWTSRRTLSRRLCPIPATEEAPFGRGGIVRLHHRGKWFNGSISLAERGGNAWSACLTRV